MKRDNVKCNVKFCVIICLDLKDGLTCTKVMPVVEFQRGGSLLNFGFISSISFTMFKKCSTVQRFIRKRNTTYELGTLKRFLKLQNNSAMQSQKWEKSWGKKQCHESRKRHLRRPHFSKGLTKLAILPDYECPGLICLALPARRKFGLILVIKFFFS